MNTMETTNILDLKLTDEQVQKHLTIYFKQREMRKERNLRYANTEKGKITKTKCQKNYYEKNKDALIVKSKTHYEANKEAINLKKKENRRLAKIKKLDDEDEAIRIIITRNRKDENYSIGDSVDEIREILKRPRK